jgi:uncharacterized protein (DUF885 family)
MHRHRVLLVLLFAACTRASEPAKPEPPDGKVRELADAYVAAFFQQFPEQATYYSLKDKPHDRLTDLSPASQKAWEAKEDQWLAGVKAIDPQAIQSASLRSTYEILREELDASVQRRVCRIELWNVSQMQGWLANLGYLVTIQPTGTDQARKEAIARWRSLPAYLNQHTANLREGLKLGYTAPKHIVRIVAGQIRQMAATPVADSPFYSPAVADKTPEFQAEFRRIVQDEILPAALKYADFLEKEYLPAAREAIAVSSNPDGAACYAASIRAWSTLPKAPQEVHDIGLREVARLDAEMKAIAERSFKTSDVQALMQRLRTDPRYTFKNREELIGYSRAALARAKAAAPQWFGILPKADVRIEPYPAYREQSGAPGEYNSPAEDGSRPGLFYINASEPTKTTRADNESTAFHETIPGHHLQGAIAIERRDNHPLARYLGNSGYAEGWALYAEELADEMKLYSSDLDRLGMLSSQNWRAARLVVDTGLHSLGWTRRQAIDYMLAHTPQSVQSATSEVDRYIIMPGQATAYMLGKLEIVAARRDAEQKLGDAFDIKRFHDRVLDEGAVPLSYLRSKLASPDGARARE